MATLKELRVLEKQAQEAVVTIQRRIEAVLEKRKKTCSHPKTKIVSRSYFDPGKMDFPVEWKEKICRRCNKLVAESHEPVKDVWITPPEDIPEEVPKKKRKGKK